MREFRTKKNPHNPTNRSIWNNIQRPSYKKYEEYIYTRTAEEMEDRGVIDHSSFSKTKISLLPIVQRPKVRIKINNLIIQITKFG